jgi:hypothetical protein
MEELQRQRVTQEGIAQPPIFDPCSSDSGGASRAGVSSIFGARLLRHHQDHRSDGET